MIFEFNIRYGDRVHGATFLLLQRIQNLLSIERWPSTMYNRPHMETTRFKDVYAPSGFDLLNILVSFSSFPVKPRHN